MSTDMKVLLYTKDYDTVKESGVGKAIDHQIRALSLIGCDFTLDEKDDYDLVHINTVFPKSVAFANKAHRDGKRVVYHLSLIHISEPTRPSHISRMPSSA